MKDFNVYEEVQKILFPDGFNVEEQHGLWKLKKTLSYDEWMKVKSFFKYYNHTDKNINNSKYYGWMTTQPVQVMFTLKEENNKKGVLI